LETESRHAFSRLYHVHMQQRIVTVLLPCRRCGDANAWLAVVEVNNRTVVVMDKIIATFVSYPSPPLNYKIFPYIEHLSYTILHGDKNGMISILWAKLIIDALPLFFVTLTVLMMTSGLTATTPMVYAATATLPTCTDPTGQNLPCMLIISPLPPPTNAIQCQETTGQLLSCSYATQYLSNAQ